LLISNISEILTIKPKNLISKSLKKPSFVKHRNLADDDNNFDYDLSSYGVQFTKCQYVKTFDDTVAQNKYISSVFSMKQFIVYKLCPKKNNNEYGSSTCDSSSNYGEYAVNAEDYLNYVVDQTRENFEELCDEFCDKECNENSNNNRCNKCKVCSKVEELENNGYVDASTLTTCQKVQFGNDDDANAMTLYVGPRCYKYGKLIKIDVFSDYTCTTPYGVNVEDVLGYKLHYYVLNRALGSAGCISCSDNDDDEKQDNDNAETLEFCQNLYTYSAKCETKHGFQNGLSSVDSSSPELSNEYDACTFIDSLVWNSYNQNGEISYQEPQDAILRTLTTVQRLMISFLAFSIITIGVYANYLQKKIARTKAEVEERLMGGYAHEAAPKSPLT